MNNNYFNRKNVTLIQPLEYIEIYNQNKKKYEWVKVITVHYDKDTITVIDANENNYIFNNDKYIVSTNSPEGRLNAHVIPEWDDYFLNIAKSVSLRAKCRRRSVGAVIVDVENRILSTGYAGFPSGVPDCLDGVCPRGLSIKGEVLPDDPYEKPNTVGYCPSIHAEMNAIHYARTNLNNCTIYITDKPCPGCQKQLAAVGIIRAVWLDGEFNPLDFYTT